MTNAAERKRAILARVAEVLGQPLVQAGLDVLLPNGRRLVVCWSKPHHGGRDYYVGLPNRLLDDDALIVGLGEDDLVFPVAGWLLQYSSLFSQSNDGRPIPRFLHQDGNLLLSVAELDLVIRLDQYIGDYRSLVEVPPLGALPSRAAELRRPFRKPEARRRAPRRPFIIDPDKVERATGPYRHSYSSCRASEGGADRAA
jgi:hypothetical protein